MKNPNLVDEQIVILATVDSQELLHRLEQEFPAPALLVIAADEPTATRRLRDTPVVDVVIIPESLAAIHWIVDDGLLLAKALRRSNPTLAIVLLSDHPESMAATEATKARLIYQAVSSNWRNGELRAAANRAYQAGEMRNEVESLRVHMNARIDTLTALNEVASAMTGLGSYDQLVKTVAREVFRVVHFDLAGVLVVVDHHFGPILHLHCRQPCDNNFLRTTRDRCVELYRSTSGRFVDEDLMYVTVSGDRLSPSVPSADIGSCIHVPIELDDNVIGIILLASRTLAEFSTEDDKLLGFVADRAADAVRRLAHRLHDERMRLSHMVESMADGLILVDPKTDEILINPAARRMVGLPAEEPVSSADIRRKLGFHPYHLITARGAGISRPRPIREEIHLGDQTLHSLVSPVQDGAGQLVGVVVVLRDISEAKELARRQREFVSIVSHELRTPLTSITGALDIVLNDYVGRLAEKQRRYLQMARDSCVRLNVIVDDLLDIARSEDGRMPIHFTVITLDELSREAIERYRPAAQGKGVRLTLRRESHELRILGDPDRLTQVMDNLLSNAVKFTPEGGAIEVEVFASMVAQDHVGVSVYNDGQPIADADRERVFEKFEQLEDSATRREGGTGLGLSISRAIIEGHNGRIWVETLAKGTRFVFTLPAAPTADTDDEDTVLSDPDPGDSGESSAATVLLVDPDRKSTYILKGMLMTAGHEVLLASDHDTALSVARSRQPKLLVVDAMSIPTEAVTLVEIFKHDPELRGTAVMVVGADDHREQALRAGADEFIAKPIESEAFRAACANAIAKAGKDVVPRILVIDDDPYIRTICREVLVKHGYEVRDVGDGATALAEAAQFRPDLLIVDVMMPNMDGFDVAERFRQQTTTSMTPIIFVSAKSETADKVRAFRIGAEDYLVKPFDALELEARVAKALQRHARELGASPTTQLPGSDAIEAEFKRRLAAGIETAFCYLDLDNLKAFNDYYGYAKADGVIRQIGDLIRDVVAREGSDDDFIGHIAGDDFVFVTSPAVVEQVSRTICTSFDRLAPLYYNKADRERGYIETKDRYDVMRRFPIMSVSIAVVTTKMGIKSFSDLAVASAEGKKLAKSIIGSSYVCDGTIVIGTPSDRAASVAEAVSGGRDDTTEPEPSSAGPNSKEPAASKASGG